MTLIYFSDYKMQQALKLIQKQKLEKLRKKFSVFTTISARNLVRKPWESNIYEMKDQ